MSYSLTPLSLHTHTSIHTTGAGGTRGARAGGGRRRAPTVVPGDDLRLDLTVPFKTSIFGGFRVWMNKHYFRRRIVENERYNNITI